MDRNIKIARQLVRIARELVANDEINEGINEINAGADEKMQSGVIFDLDAEPVAGMRSASRSRVAFLESPWEGDDNMTMMERLGVMFRSIFKSKKTLEEEKRMLVTVDEMNAKIDEEKKRIHDELKNYSSTFDQNKFEVFMTDVTIGMVVVFRKSDSARLQMKFAPGNAYIDIKDRKIVVDKINETPFVVSIDIPDAKNAKPFVRGKLDKSVYNGGKNLTATFKSFDQFTKYADDNFKK